MGACRSSGALEALELARWDDLPEAALPWDRVAELGRPQGIGEADVVWDLTGRRRTDRRRAGVAARPYGAESSTELGYSRRMFSTVAVGTDSSGDRLQGRDSGRRPGPPLRARRSCCSAPSRMRGWTPRNQSGSDVELQWALSPSARVREILGPDRAGSAQQRESSAASSLTRATPAR